MDLPSGTITFLFTDIQASTELLAQVHATKYAALLAAHHAIVREALAHWQGREMDTQGDAFFAVFSRAAEAVAAAVEAQRALANVDLGGRVRMGLHTGAATLTATGYVGMDVHRAARINSVGHGGQVLLSEATCALVRNELPEGVSLRDLGSHRLKDLQAAEHLSQLVISGLPADFPPLTSLDAVANNLPVQLTNFIGRERELGEIREYLAPAQGTRLLTLTGTGGTGKTRLALQVAADLLNDFADGVWLVELAPLADPALIPQTIAAALGVREQPGRPVLDTLLDYVRGKKLLLILDNCEHLIDMAAQVANTLLRTAPGVKIIATSREALGIGGEVSYRVPSLSLPENRRHSAPSMEPMALAALLQCESVRLFVARASAVQSRFQVTLQNAPAISQIVRRLDGIPLAIELAAARSKLFSPEQIAARLDDHFRLLTGGSRTALPRQQTLRALIDWSYDLLSEPERRLLRRLSVFVGSWTYEAAEAIAAEDVGEPDFIDVLAHLVDKSLVIVEEQETETRYRLLEMIRQYARDKLLEAAEAPEIRNRHLDYYLALVESMPSAYGPWHPIDVAHFKQLRAEHDNIRAALAWALESAPLKALQISTLMVTYWQRTALMTEGREWIEEALARAGSDTQPPTRAHAHFSLGMLLFAQGQSAAARAALETSIGNFRTLGDLTGVAAGTALLALADRFLGNDAAALAEVNEAEAIARISGEKWVLIMALGIHARIAAEVEHDLAAARRLLEESIALGKSSGNQYLGMPLMSLGMLNALHGDYEMARKILSEAIETFRAQEDEYFCSVARSQLAETARLQGDWGSAVALYHETISAWHRYGHQGGLARCLECLGFIAIHQAAEESGDTRPRLLSRAATLLGAAETLRQSSDSTMMPEESAEYEREVATLRAQMDPATLAAAWDQGRALSPDEAITLAKS